MSLLFFLLPFLVFSQQKDKQISFALTNSHTAYPFASFSKLFSGPYHPGFELGYGFNWTNRKKHDWYQAFRLGYSITALCNTQFLCTPKSVIVTSRGAGLILSHRCRLPAFYSVNSCAEDE